MGLGANVEFGADDQRVATVALMMRVLSADGLVGKEERDKVRSLIKADYNLAQIDADALMAAAAKVDSEASNLSSIVDAVKYGLNETERAHIIDMLWQITVADGHIHEFEDSLVWRIADMLGVPVHDRVALRKRAGQSAHSG